MGFRDALSYVMYAIIDFLLNGILMELTAEYLTRKADKLQEDINTIAQLLTTPQSILKSKPPIKRHKIEIS